MTTSPNNLRQTRMILIGAAVLLSLGMGIRQSFGLFLTPVTRDLALTAADFTLAVAVQNIVWGISQAPVGAIADRFGLRATMMAGAAIYVVGLAVMAAAQGTPALIVSGGVDWRGPVVRRLVAGNDGRGPRRLGRAPEPNVGRGRRRGIPGHAIGPACDAGPTCPPNLADRRAVLPRSRGCDAPGGLLRRRSRPDAGAGRSQDDDARGDWRRPRAIAPFS